MTKHPGEVHVGRILDEHAELVMLLREGRNLMALMGIHDLDDRMYDVIERWEEQVRLLLARIEQRENER